MSVESDLRGEILAITAERDRARREASLARGERDAYMRDMRAMAERAAELAAKLTAAERERGTMRVRAVGHLDESNCPHNTSIDPDTGMCGSCGAVLP